jgi:hypothetical protein
VAGSCEHGNEPSGSIKIGDFLLDKLTISFSGRALFHGVSFRPLKHHNFSVSHRFALTKGLNVHVVHLLFEPYK